MAILTVLPSQQQIEFQPGTTLLAALVGAGVGIGAKCQGKAECGACHLFVQEGRKTISKMQPAENAKLDTIVGVGSKSRLACQTILGGENVTVELLGFASGF